MIKKLRHAIKHSIVYSLSNVATKAIGIILLPIYTDYFTLEQYGNLGLLLVTIIIVSQVLVAGQGQAVIRFNNAPEFKNEKRSIFFTLTVMLFVIVLTFSVISELFLPHISKMFSKPDEYYVLIRISIYIISFTIINILFLNQLRADERSIAFTLIGIAKLLMTLLLTIYLIIYAKQGIEAVLYGQLAGEVINFIFILPMMVRKMDFKFNKAIIPESLKFGIPLIFGALAMNLLNGSDRYVLKYLSGASQLGLYELGYKVAGVLNMFVLMPISLTLLPMAYNVYQKEGDKRFYSKIMTYVTFILVWSGLALSLFGKEIIKMFSSNPNYYPAYTVVPLITLSYVLFGMSMVTALGMYLTGKTNMIAVINLIGAGLNIGLNFWLIPKMGMMGAAINTLVAFMFLLVFSYYFSNSYYKIAFEIKKLGLMLFLGCLLFVISIPFEKYGIIINVLIKLILSLLFPFLLYLFKFYEVAELKNIKIIVKLITNFSESKEKASEILSKFIKP